MAELKLILKMLPTVSLGRHDVVSDNNRVGSLPTENFFCEMEYPQGNRKLSTAFIIGKKSLVKLTPITHKYEEII